MLRFFYKNIHEGREKMQKIMNKIVAGLVSATFTFTPLVSAACTAINVTEKMGPL